MGRVALDGSKIKANASKHKAMSYGRMREKQRQLREEVTQLLAQAEAADAAEDARVRAPIGAATSCRRNCNVARVGWNGFAKPNGPWRRGRRTRPPPRAQPTESAKPDPKAQYNFTDPESRIMKGPDGFVQAYNAQVAVDELQLIVGHAVTQETNDKQQLLPMITTIERAVGRHADAAARRRRLLLGRELGRDRRHGHRRVHLDAETETWRAAGAVSARPAADDRHASSTGCPASCTRRPARRSMRRAKAIVEPVIGQIKQARGFRQFLLRGLEKVQGEWSLVCTTHNILKLYRLCD